MELSFFRRFGAARRPLARAGAAPLLAVILAGLLAEVVNHEEARAGIDYGLSLLALLGATGCIVSLAGRRGSNTGPLSWAGLFAPAPGPFAPSTSLPTRGEDWPLLISLLFGALLALLSGLGGWV